MVSRTARSSSARRADDVRGHDRGRCLAKCTGFHVMREIGDDAVPHLEIDRTVEPQSLECAIAVASGWSSRPIRAIFPAKARIFAL